MATAVDLHVWRRSAEPEVIDRELTALWAELGREQPLARAMMSNLVIMKECPPGKPLDLGAAPEGIPLDEVARRHPARILLVYHVPRAPANCPPIAASVSVTTFGSAAARYGIETITVESRCAESSLPSIVRRLTVGDLPVTIWWTDDLSQGAPPASLASLARQVLYDSRTWRDPAAGFRAAARILESDPAPDLADLNWRRLAPLRTALASIVRWRREIDASGLHALIRHRPGERALADLLAGWMAARMRWTASAWPLETVEERHGDDVLTLTLSSDGERTIVVEQSGRRVLVRDASAAAPIVLPVPRESTADAVAAELASLAQDLCLRDAVRALDLRSRA